LRIFFDTEFTQFRDGELLSIGFVSDVDNELVVEIHDPALYSRASDFCRTTVISQFGAVSACAVSTEAQAGTVIANWLEGFALPLTLCYDYKLDWHFLERALRAAGAWSRLATAISGFNVADVANHDSCLLAQEAYFHGKRDPGRHHPLVDALAMRERWRAYERLAASGE